MNLLTILNSLISSSVICFFAMATSLPAARSMPCTVGDMQSANKRTHLILSGLAAGSLLSYVKCKIKIIQ